MDLARRKEIKILLRKHGVSPQKRLGQHFLVDRSILRKILEAAGIQRDDIVLEIGPGIGMLTQGLAQRAKRVIAIEKDKKMAEILTETLGEYKNVEVILADVLKTQKRKVKLKTKTYKIVANLPYYIVAPVIRMFLEAKSPPREMILMVQKEVAQRICAKPPKMNLLAVSVQFYAKPTIVRYVSKNSFWPRPKVESAIIKITRIRKDRRGFSHGFFRVVRAGFSHQRKQLINNLSRGLKMEKQSVNNLLLRCGVNPAKRAGDLRVSEWINIARMISLQ